MIMLFWETIQCNKRFRSFIVDTERGHDFVILVLYYAIENRADPTKQGIVRMCVFVLQTLSVEENFGNGLNKAFLRQETLPAAIRIEDWGGTYGDFLIVVGLISPWIHQTGLLTVTVNTYTYHGQQRQAGCNLPGLARNHQQRSGIP